MLWYILCLPVANKFKSLFVPCSGTFCAFPWHILCLAVAHGMMVFCSLLSRIASQELQIKNCKSRIASQELQKSLLDSFFLLMNERIFSLVQFITIYFYFFETE
jgi:hypothetical protein